MQRGQHRLCPRRTPADQHRRPAAQRQPAERALQAFDATKGAFTIDAQVLGPINQLTGNYQQIGAFFGPDQSNFLKVEAEHNGGSGETRT